MTVFLLSKRAKMGYFALAIVTMLTLALASITAAQGWARWSTALFILAVIEVGGGFSVRRRLLRSARR
ncbi:MAG: hypothetical protein IRZ10_07110 [Thermoflavifilum sp.]|nr:hypothetical protein [Thermoflavifilum sp.]MCL6514177.1 hypothetical protein [Alicyclobacillus sp.]